VLEYTKKQKLGKIARYNKKAIALEMAIDHL
jgi:hypothetical protein